MLSALLSVIFFFFNDTATTEIYTLSLHDALPILAGVYAHALHRFVGPVERILLEVDRQPLARALTQADGATAADGTAEERSEEHTSELQSQSNLVCRLLLEKKKIT